MNSIPSRSKISRGCVRIHTRRQEPRSDFGTGARPQRTLDRYPTVIRSLAAVTAAGGARPGGGAASFVSPGQSNSGTAKRGCGRTRVSIDLVFLWKTRKVGHRQISLAAFTASVLTPPAPPRAQPRRAAPPAQPHQRLGIQKVDFPKSQEDCGAGHRLSPKRAGPLDDLRVQLRAGASEGSPSQQRPSGECLRPPALPCRRRPGRSGASY